MSKEMSISSFLASLGATPRVVRSAGRRKRRRIKREKFLRGHVWDVYDNMFNLKEIMSNNEQIFLGVSDVEDLITSKIIERRVSANRTTVQRETSVLANRNTWKNWSEEEFETNLFVQTNSSTGFIVDQATDNFIKFDVNSNATTVKAFGDADYCKSVIEVVESKFDVVTCNIEWVYGADGNSVNVPLNRERLPIEEMYPFLNGESLASYYDRFMESSANILLLIGPPGTGKTTFIRGLLAHSNANAVVSYDAAILDKDGFFARFIEGDDNVMVLEDSDAFLKPRTEGNTMMHRFLNVGDGLVTTKGKKMIFSTNLPSIRDIDSALTRPGRCFDIITFDELTYEDAKKLAVRLGVGEVEEGKKKYSIADIFNKQVHKPVERKVGFL